MKAPENLPDQMAEKSKAELLEMFDEPEDWMPAALEAAQTELQKRGVEPPRITKPIKLGAPLIQTFTFQGIGTALYGKRDFSVNGSYVTTEWFVFLFIPILPRRSLRVRLDSGGGVAGYHASNYTVYEAISPPNLKQVLCVYAFVALCFVWLHLMSSVIAPCMNAFVWEHFARPTGDYVFAGTMLFSLPFPAAFPLLARWFARRRNAQT